MARGNRKSYTKKILKTDGIIFKRDDNGEETFYNLAHLPAEMIIKLTIHGLSQKLGDLSSLDEVTTPATMIAACDELWDAMKAGNWTVATEPRAKMTDAEKREWYARQIAKLDAAIATAGPVNI